MSLKPSLVAAISLAALSLAAAGVLAQDVAPDPAIASMTVEQMIEKRQATMKEDGGILKTAGTLSGADAVAAADKLIQNFTNLQALFPPGSNVGKSDAMANIWDDFDDFQGRFINNVELSKAMKAAAEAGDAAAYGDVVKQIGSSCGACHQNYRAS
jgi:cytochrome c556